MDRPAPSSGRGAVELGLPTPLSERLFLGRFSRLLSVAPRGAGALVEWRSAGIGPVVGVADGPGRAWIEEAGEGLGRTERPAPPLPSPHLREGWRIGVLDPLGATGPRTLRPAIRGGDEGRPDTVVAGRLDPPGGRWAVQFHLFSVGRPGSLQGSVRLALFGPDPPGQDREARLVGHLTERLAEVGQPAGYRSISRSPRHLREWASGAMGSVRSRPGFDLGPGQVGALGPIRNVAPFPGSGGPCEHAVVLGASGAGKTVLLASWGAEAIRAGRTVAAFDLHGDLGPALLARVPAAIRDRIVVLDAGTEGARSPGIDVLDGNGERDAVLLVAALRRSSQEGGELYWGFRLERIFDIFVRLVLEERGTLCDLFDLLTDERRREAARLATRSESAARFLDELRGILRRNPEFLWPAAARISKIALSAPLARLVAPTQGRIDPGELFEAGRSLVLRLPMGQLGPEGTTLAATLLAARIYLDRTRDPGPKSRPLLLLFDEAQSISPILLEEILSEGRKFGVTAVVATQFPGRLEGRLRDAAAGSVGAHLVLRTPRAGAAVSAPWLGLPVIEAEEWLPGLSPGSALASLPREDRPRFLPARGPSAAPDEAEWQRRLRAASREFGSAEDAAEAAEGGSRSEDLRLLLALRAQELERPRGRPLDLTPIRDGRADPQVPEGGGSRALSDARRRGWIVRASDGAWVLTRAGRSFVGETLESGAVRESAEHRALLSEAFRLFARRGEHLEILRQGRFDTRLPDARLRLLGEEPAGSAPGALRELLERRSRSWAWRAFDGRDVHVEAEVSGADRRPRLIRDLQKARAASAHCLFLVSEPGRAARIRSVLKERGIPRQEATVWVLRAARSPAPPGPVDPPVPDISPRR